MRVTHLVAAAFMVITATVPPSAQIPRPATRGLSPRLESLAGMDTFAFYCAGCHGKGGRGDGPVAPSLKTRVPDLTTISQRNGGQFPRARVVAAVSNTERPLLAHSTGDMPVWGTIFGVLDPSDVEATVRIDRVVSYVETLQGGVAASAVMGQSLFASYCAVCHGEDARGGGPMAGQLRRAVPDLTLFAMRNGNAFPSLRVMRLIDGRDVPSHGNREMPVWGDAFRSTPGGMAPGTVTMRIESLTAYLEGIQQRNGE